MDFVIIFFGAIIGAILGSFACCQACRLRIKEKHGENPGPRSICLSCRKKLKWYDNLPIISWLMLKGRCRYCKKPIGLSEILSEVSMSAIIALLANFYLPSLLALDPLAITNFLLLSAVMTIFWILLLYDAKYGRLPTSLLLSAILLALAFRLLNLDYSSDLWPQLFNLLSAISLLAGLYYILYMVSNEKWVGGGDWLLALSIALILGNWWLALVELAVSNSLALGGILAHSRREKTRSAPFAPYLIISCIIIFILQSYISTLPLQVLI